MYVWLRWVVLTFQVQPMCVFDRCFCFPVRVKCVGCVECDFGVSAAFLSVVRVLLPSIWMDAVFQLSDDWTERRQG